MDKDIQWLDNGWKWLAANEGDPRYEDMERAWIARLRKYEEAYRMAHPGRYAGKWEAQS